MDFQKYFFKVQIWLLYSWIILRVWNKHISLFLKKYTWLIFFYPHSISNLDLSEVAFHTITRISLKLLWKGTYIILISGMKWLSSTSWSLFTQFFFQYFKYASNDCKIYQKPSLRSTFSLQKIRLHAQFIFLLHSYVLWFYNCVYKCSLCVLFF